MMRRPMSAPRTRPQSTAAPPPQTQFLFDEDGDIGVDDDDRDDGDDGDEDEIDLDTYEAYLAEIKSKAEARPQSARSLRPYPSESPQFYMVNTANPVTPINTAPPPPNNPTTRVPSRPSARPMSARPRMTSAGENTLVRPGQVPRAPQTARPSTAGMRRKRQVKGEPLNTRIRAVYSDVRGGPVTTPRMGSSVSPSHTASSVIQGRQRIFQEAELLHEYHRLVDMINDLRTVVQHEQSQRLKAMARVRRLEEIATMKDRKIEALLHGQSIGISSHDPVSSAAQREMAQRERYHHNMMQKLRHKLAQQNQLVASYEEAMQALRTSVKSTHLMEIEEENKQLQLEIARLNEILVLQEDEKQYYARQISDLKAGESHFRTQLAKSHQELKRSDHERHKLEQEALFLRAVVQQLEQRLVVEQKKRVYDQVVASKRSPMAVRSPRSLASGMSPHPSLPDPSVSLAEALAEMRMLKAPTSPTMKYRRPTPISEAMPPTSPTTSQVDEDGERRRDPLDVVFTQAPQPTGVLKKADSPRSAEDKRRKQVRWTEDQGLDQEEELIEEARHGQQGFQGDDIGEIDADLGGEQTPSPFKGDGELEDQEQDAKEPTESDKTAGIDVATLAAKRIADSRSHLGDDGTESIGHPHVSESPPPGEQNEFTAPSPSSSEQELALARVDSASSSSASASSEPSYSASSSSSDLLVGQPPSSSGSSSLASLLAREDAALMAAEASSHDGPSSSQLVYDSDFSDDDATSDGGSNPSHSC